MGLFDRLVVIFCKNISIISKFFGFGAGETWPGEIALRLSPRILTSLASQLKKGVVLIAGTNGKTTTTLMVKTILEKNGFSAVHNASGANLLNGIVSSLIRHADWSGKLSADWGIFEVDENSLPIVLRFVKPKKIALLNVFRDQLDRYGEVDVIVEKWANSLKEYDLILNADDPAVAYLGKNNKALYFGVNDKNEFLKEKEHATDSTFCPNCGNRLSYDGIFYSHLGHWNCEKCNNKRPKPGVFMAKSPLPGLYNQYNTLAAVAIATTLGIKNGDALLEGFMPAFGRQEEFSSSNVKLFLSKNPAGFNASIRTVKELGAKHILVVLNDRIPDGRDVSWIWDVDFEHLQGATITVSGDRVYDLALRMQYAEIKNFIVEENLEEAIQKSLTGEKLYILATYSAMLECRKILTGKKIL